MRLALIALLLLLTACATVERPSSDLPSWVKPEDAAMLRDLKANFPDMTEQDQRFAVRYYHLSREDRKRASAQLDADYEALVRMGPPPIYEPLPYANAPYTPFQFAPPVSPLRYDQYSIQGQTFGCSSFQTQTGRWNYCR
jgi:hypothetical protein